MKLRKFQSVLLATSGVLLSACPAAYAVDAAVAGVVRDSRGIPQMDVLVQLIRADSSVIQAVRTDARGRYVISGILPGVYQLKAVETSFLPTLRENLRVGTRGRTEANLTLSTLMEALQWLPAHKRTSTEPEDDWTWTLRSAAYRPLLRFVGEDGLETVETRESQKRQHQGRFLIESGTRSFGQGGPSEMVEFQREGAHGTQTLMRARISDSPQAATELMAGFAHENAVGSGLSSVIAYQMDPAVSSGTTPGGMRLLRLRTADTIKLSPDLTAEVGNQMQMLALGPASATSFAPFANVVWTRGAMTASYALATTPGLINATDLADQRSLVPMAEMRGGVLGIEHGLHQELRLAHTDESEVMTESIAVYQDAVRNPIVDGMVRSSGPVDLAAGSYLYDSQTGIARVAGNGYTSRGVVAQVTRTGPASTRASVQYMTGSVLTLADNTGASPSFHPQQAQALAILVRGASKSSGTNWRASYRWQSVASVNAVDLFDTGMADAYLSLFLRQSLHLSHIVPGGVDAVVDVRNLLAQGYHPFLTSDGSQLFFAQVTRSVQGGLAFYF